MAKKMPDDLFGKLAEKKEQGVRPASDRSPTIVRQESDYRPTMERYSIRLDPDDWAALEAHFTERGLTATTGIRMVLRDYLRRI